ncbi:SDR family oxidoreductase [Gloeobacter kilaueensis]|uniref:Short chain dehydrogenase n=1 Tax=Gloeobacter kilaueensis (strain ATCC BAA-2537 / CCAP 1431/1 / ULC 316 / JS1) TaxID=1183438 RepID=U5QJ75_GLOK1|nr:SDR family oxidoreductase [Gloeobacter kilaueensis]AGY57730.1 short chain dehydrogenase [Gloeobacter kilaueensis JS1]
MQLDSDSNRLPVALVSGASSGIGQATARRLAQAGFAVALVARNRERLAGLQAELPTATSLTIAQDLTDFAALGALVEAVEAKLGPIAVLVNNAGMAYTGPLETMPVADWEQVLKLNLTAPFALTRAVLPTMRQRRTGTIINMVSIAGKQTFADWGAYCASKFGLLAFSRTLAQEVRQDGIRVTALCPGAVDTALWDSEAVTADFDRQAMLAAETVADLVLYAASLPERAVLEEVVLMPSGGVL